MKGNYVKRQFKLAIVWAQRQNFIGGGPNCLMGWSCNYRPEPCAPYIRVHSCTSFFLKPRVLVRSSSIFNFRNPRRSRRTRSFCKHGVRLFASRGFWNNALKIFWDNGKWCREEGMLGLWIEFCYGYLKWFTCFTIFWFAYEYSIYISFELICDFYSNELDFLLWIFQLRLYAKEWMIVRTFSAFSFELTLVGVLHVIWNSVDFCNAIEFEWASAS